jgi:F-type H+-transporting ATPase subunit b
MSIPVLTSLAAAAEAGVAPRSHAPQLIDVDGTALIQFGLFVIAAFILTRLLWRPYLRVKGERITRVDGYRKDAARMEVDAAERLARAERELAEARRLGSGDRTVARAEAQAREQTMVAEAQAHGQRALAEARKKVDATLAAERARLQTSAVDIARKAAGRILGRELGGA